MKEIREKIRILLEAKHLHSGYLEEIQKILLNFFIQNKKKRYYVINLVSFSIDRHFTSNSNSDCIVIVDTILSVFQPEIGSVLNMKIIDIDKRNKFSIAQYQDIEFKVSIDGLYNPNTYVDIEIENLKNYKNQIIGIGKIVNPVLTVF